MSHFRISAKDIKSINIHDEKTYPSDLKMWVHFRGILADSPPWYLNYEDVKYFQHLFRYREWMDKQTARSERHRIIKSRIAFLEPLGIRKVKTH